MGRLTTSQLIGVDVTQVYDAVSASLPEVPGQPFRLGTIVDCEDGQQYMFVTASGAIAQYACVAIDENNIAGGSTTARAATATRPGWAQVAFTDNQSGWVAIGGEGLLKGKLKDNVAVDSQLFTTTSVGIMGTDASTGNPYMIAGCRVAVAGSGAGNPGQIIAINPHFVRTPAMA